MGVSRPRLQEAAQCLADGAHHALPSGVSRPRSGDVVRRLRAQLLLVPSNRVGGRDEDSSDKSLLAVQSAWTIVVLLGYSALSTYSQPFKDTDDQVDTVASYTALTVAVLGCIASQVDGGETAFGVLLNLPSSAASRSACMCSQASRRCRSSSRSSRSE